MRWPRHLGSGCKQAGDIGAVGLKGWDDGGGEANEKGKRDHIKLFDTYMQAGEAEGFGFG